MYVSAFINGQRKNKAALGFFLQILFLLFFCVACNGLVHSNRTIVQNNSHQVDLCADPNSQICNNSDYNKTPTVPYTASNVEAASNERSALSVITGSSPAQTVNMTMAEAVARALEFNRDLLNQRLDREVDKFSLELASDRYTPKYSISPSIAKNDNTLNSRLATTTSFRLRTGGQVSLSVNKYLTEGKDSPGEIRLSFSHPLFKGAGRDIETVSEKKAWLAEKSSILSLREAVARLVIEVEQSYRDLLNAYQQIEINEVALQRAQDQMKVTNALIQTGRVARREEIRARSTIATRELSLARARNRLEQINFNFVRMVNLEGDTRVLPSDKLTVELREDDLVPEFNDVLEKRSDFQKAKMRVETAQIDLNVSRNNLLPNVSFGVDVNIQDGGPSDTSVRIGATIPLNDRQPKLQHIRAKNELIKAERNLFKLRDSIIIELRQAVNSVEEGLFVLELAEGARELAEQNLTVERNKFGQGLSTSFEVTTLGDELVQAEQATIDAMSSYIGALTRLDQATGETLERRGIKLEYLSP